MSGDILIHSDLAARLRGQVSVEAIGLYVLISHHCAAASSNGRFHIAGLCEYLRETKEDRVSIWSALQQLERNGFIDKCPHDIGMFTVSDWGEWVVEAGGAGMCDG